MIVALRGFIKLLELTNIAIGIIAELTVFGELAADALHRHFVGNLNKAARKDRDIAFLICAPAAVIDIVFQMARHIDGQRMQAFDNEFRR